MKTDGHIETNLSNPRKLNLKLAVRKAKKEHNCPQNPKGLGFHGTGFLWMWKEAKEDLLKVYEAVGASDSLAFSGSRINSSLFLMENQVSFPRASQKGSL